MNAEKIFGENVYVNLDEVIETVYQCRGDVADKEWEKRWLEPLENLPRIEVSEDCISRKWLEEHKEVISYKNMWHMTETGEFVSWENIENAPSVVPKPKEGEWAVKPGRKNEFRCSKCGKIIYADCSSERNYCPNCGSKNKVNYLLKWEDMPLKGVAE